VNVQVGLRVLPWIIHDQPHGQCKRLQAPADCTCSIWNTRARPHLRMTCARVTTTPGRRRCVRSMRALVSCLRRLAGFNHGDSILAARWPRAEPCL
jgi:hypothetical protein